MPRNNGHERRKARRAEAAARAEVTGQLHPTQRLVLLGERLGAARKERVALGEAQEEVRSTKRRRARRQNAEVEAPAAGPSTS
jgi:hypothetical protein